MWGRSVCGTCSPAPAKMVRVYCAHAVLESCQVCVKSYCLRTVQSSLPADAFQSRSIIYSSFLLLDLQHFLSATNLLCNCGYAAIGSLLSFASPILGLDRPRQRTVRRSVYKLLWSLRSLLLLPANLLPTVLYSYWQGTIWNAPQPLTVSGRWTRDLDFWTQLHLRSRRPHVWSLPCRKVQPTLSPRLVPPERPPCLAPTCLGRSSVTWSRAASQQLKSSDFYNLIAPTHGCNTTGHLRLIVPNPTSSHETNRNCSNLPWPCTNARALLSFRCVCSQHLALCHRIQFDRQANLCIRRY